MASGAAVGKDDLATRTRVNESAHALTRRLVARGRAFAQEMDAPMDVGVLVLVDVADGVDDVARLLRRRRVVEIDQRLPVDLAPEDGEVPAHASHVEGAGVPGGLEADHGRAVGHHRSPSRVASPPGLLQRAPERFSRAGVADLVERACEERLDEHLPCLAARNAARVQVEQHGLVELARRRAVRALDVVGVDLELGLRVHLGARRQQNRLVKLVAVGLLGVLADQDLSLEHSARRVADHTHGKFHARSRRRPRGRSASCCPRGNRRTRHTPR